MVTIEVKKLRRASPPRAENSHAKRMHTCKARIMTYCFSETPISLDPSMRPAMMMALLVALFTGLLTVHSLWKSLIRMSVQQS